MSTRFTIITREKNTGTNWFTIDGSTLRKLIVILSSTCFFTNFNANLLEEQSSLKHLV